MCRLLAPLLFVSFHLDGADEALSSLIPAPDSLLGAVADAAEDEEWLERNREGVVRYVPELIL